MSVGLNTPKRVVVVDDSLSLRGWLRTLLNADPRLDVVGEAGSAQEARAVIKAVNPDIITLDVEMPDMNGLDFLERLMRLRPMPVVMFSSQTSRGSTAAIQAMSLGAVDCIWKLDKNKQLEDGGICERVFQASHARVVERLHDRVPAQNAGASLAADFPRDAIVLVGASTGGVAALEVFLAHLPTNAPPIVIAQHMPQKFLTSFASRLDGQFPQDVAMATPGETLQPGQVRLANGGGRQSAVVFRAGQWSIREEDPHGYEAFSPSVDHLFLSAVPAARRVGAAILTGIGDDGTRGLLGLRDSGARTVGQSQDSCVVYGMPRAAHEAGAVEEQADIEHLAGRLLAKMKLSKMAS